MSQSASAEQSPYEAHSDGELQSATESSSRRSPHRDLSRRRSSSVCQLRVPSSPRSKYVSSMFGRQPLSHRTTEPVVRFGNADRVKLDKLYYNSELSKCRVGLYGPGPVYDFKSMMGKQFISIKESSPNTRFGSATRFRRKRYGEGTPGPGTYNSVSSFGPQVLSSQQSQGSADFSRSTRDQQNKVYLSSEFDKNKFGVESPGPTVCDVRSSLGPQLAAPYKSAPKISFGGERRFKYGMWNSTVISPGAGQYKAIGSVGKQQESKKSNCPAFSFAHSDRAHRAKVFISQEHDKAQYGIDSPGPGCTKKQISSLGRQVDSRKSSGVITCFGTAPRFRQHVENVPGPGEYSC